MTIRTGSKTGRAPTSTDVAFAAGVSRTTVSHILNGRGDRFPADTRDRVLAAAAALDYRPSPAGRTLVNGRSDTIIVLAPNTTWGPNLQDAVEQVANDTATLGATVVVRFAGTDDVRTTVSSILALRPFAVVDLGVLSDPDRRRLDDHGVITVPRRGTRGAATGLDRTIAELQVAELTRSGTRIVHFAALADGRADRYGPLRHKHLTDVCRAAGLPVPQRAAISLQLREAKPVVQSLATAGPVGLACYNDDVAIAVLASARQLGLAVPEQVAVVGVDHTPIGQLWSPPLTTVRIDIRELMDSAIHDLRVQLGHEVAEPPQSKELALLVRGGSS